MSPELVSLVSYFLRECASICTTIVIPGNHDLNLTNPNRMDALTPIVDALEIDNLVYWKDSGVKSFGDVMFHHFSVMGDRGDWVKAMPTNDPSYTHIGLYHGAVTGAQTEMGFSDFGDSLPISTFDGFDITMLGDIHMTQYLNPQKTIAYPGSLIQQDHSEGLVRGLLVWDVQSRTSKLLPIHNDHGFYTVRVVDGVMDVDLDSLQLPKNTRLRLLHENTDADVVKSVQDNLKTKFGISEMRVIGDKKKSSSHHIDVDDIINSREVDVQNKLIDEYLKSVGLDVDDDIAQRLIAINNDLNTRIRNVEVSTPGIMWRPLKFTFSNMFSYGDGNEIDFNDISGIVGLFAPNASGKSTLLDSLVYCIFDKCSRTGKAAHVMNNKSDDFYCKLEFMIGDDIFIIERIGKRSNSGNVSVKVEFKKITDGDEVILTGKRRDETNKIIRDYIGTYDDFIMTTMSTQNDHRSFIDMTKKDRQELLYRFLDIYVFIDLFKLAKEDSRDLSAEIKLLEQENFVEQIEMATASIEDSEELLKRIEERKEIVNDELDELTSKIDGLHADLKPIDESLYLPRLEEDLKYAKGTVERDIQKRDKMISDRAKLIEEYEQMKVNFESTYGDFDIESASERKRKLLEDRSRVTQLVHQYKTHEGKVDILKTHEYDPDCEYCIKNQFVVDAENSKIELTKIIEELKRYGSADILDGEIDKIREQLDNYTIASSELEACKRQILHIESEIEMQLSLISSVESKIPLIEGNIEKCKVQEGNVKYNEAIKSTIQGHKTRRSEVQIIERELNNQITDIKAKISTSLVYLQGATMRRDRYNETVSKFKAYDYYMQAVNRDGVPYMILKKILPIIESEVNDVLSGIVDFTFKLDIGENDSIDGSIMYGDKSWAIELTSGMERFILSLALRSSLIRLSGLPKPNFLAIDEGFGVLDTEKLNSIYVLFDYLKERFDFVMCISHIQGMRDFVDQLIQIEKVNGYSEIVVA